MVRFTFGWSKSSALSTPGLFFWSARFNSARSDVLSPLTWGCNRDMMEFRSCGRCNCRCWHSGCAHGCAPFGLPCLCTTKEALSIALLSSCTFCLGMPSLPPTHSEARNKLNVPLGKKNHHWNVSSSWCLNHIN